MSYDLKELCEPFRASDIEWRIQQSGHKNGKPWAMVLAYVTNRAIQMRLDDVLGAMNWKNEFKAGPDGGIICGISIWCPERRIWVEKWDGAEKTQVEAVKGGLSGSMKRAAVQWGIGRYLYSLDATFANCALDKSLPNRASVPQDPRNKQGQKIYFTWEPPKLPAWALPVTVSQQQQEQQKREPTINQQQRKSLEGAMTVAGVTEQQFCKRYDLSNMSQLPASKVDEALILLQKQAQLTQKQQAA